MDTLFELLPVLIFLLFTVAGFARSSKRDGAAPNPRGSGRADSGDGDEDFDAARRMVEELKRRARGGGGDFPRTLGGEPLVFEPDESPDGEEAEIFEEEFGEPAESARAHAAVPSESSGSFGGAGSAPYSDCRERLREVEESDAYKMKVPAHFAAPRRDFGGEESFEAGGDSGRGTSEARAAFGVRLEGGEDLRRAFVLSEIISKPLALRPRDERLSAW